MNLDRYKAIYAREALGRLDRVDAALDRGDAEAATREFHALKGGALTVGLAAEGRVAGDAESAGRAAGDAAPGAQPDPALVERLREASRALRAAARAIAPPH